MPTITSSLSKDTISKLKDNSKKMDGWARGMARREDTKKRPRSTITIHSGNESRTISRIPFHGIPSLNFMTRGGLPRGRHTVLFSQPSVGKSSSAAEAIKGAQSQGIVPILFSAEPLELEWLAVQGVDLDFLKYSEEQDIARILNAADEAARGTKEPDKVEKGNPYTQLIIIDSVAAMKHTEEELKGVGGDNMALTARRLSQFFRSFNTGFVVNEVACLWINQIRVDDMSGASYVLDNYPGGNALKFYSSLDIHIRRGGASTLSTETNYKHIFGENQDARLGFPNVYKVRKTKFFGVPERSEAVGVFYDGIGFRKHACLAEFLLSSEIATQSGSSIQIPMLDPVTKAAKNEAVTGFGNLMSYVVENYDALYQSTFDLCRIKYAEGKAMITTKDSVTLPESTSEPVNPEHVSEEARKLNESLEPATQKPRKYTKQHNKQA